MTRKKAKFTHKKRKRAKATESWWSTQMDENFVRSAIPVGPRFQADLPNWNGLANEHSNPEDSNSDNSKWLGTQNWPIEGGSGKTEVIGEGRSGFCQCVSPASVECVHHHIAERRIQLQTDLGTAFWSWKFDKMSEEEVSKMWSLEEQKTFESLVKGNPISQGKSFLEPAMDKFPTKNKQSIVSYYFNVYVPKRINNQTMAGVEVDDSDGDEISKAHESKETRKRSQSRRRLSKNVKSKFLSGRR